MDAIDARQLLPFPRKARFGNEPVRLDPDCEARFDVADPRPAREWERFKSGATRAPQKHRPITVRDGNPSPIHRSPTLTVVELPGQIGHRDGYHIRVNGDGILIAGDSAAGCFYGLKTLLQLRDPRTGQVSSGEVHDQPDFATRGLLHDVTRGKVPRLATLKLLADRLAGLKVNQLQLYIEHAFAFSFDPDICPANEGLTPDEIRELDTYCRDRFIDLVPAVATLGHMGRILSMPRYRHLAEIELTRPWQEMTWLQRLKGATLDVLNPEARALVERIWSDVLAAFSAPAVNICGDEPWDLGKGKNAGLSRSAAADAYVEHLRWTAEFCAKHGRTCQIWGDVIRNHTDLLSRLPRNMTVLHWGYDDRADYAGTSAFTAAAYDTFVCPGTSGWKRVLNAMNLAERNISTFARLGKQCGASGLLNTDWGDFGHFNQLACSWHGIALGAACGWNVDHPIGAEFDRHFSSRVLNVPPELIAGLRAASAISERCETWRALITAEQELRQAGLATTQAEWDQSAAASAAALKLLAQVKPATPEALQDRDELSLACRFSELAIERLKRLASGKSPTRDWPDRLGDAAADYSKCWLTRNKPAGLREIINAIAGRT